MQNSAQRIGAEKAKDGATMLSKKKGFPSLTVGVGFTGKIKKK